MSTNKRTDDKTRGKHSREEEKPKKRTNEKVENKVKKKRDTNYKKKKTNH